MKYLLINTIVFLSCFSLNAQTHEVSLEKPNIKYNTYNKFFKKKVVLVMGDNCPDYNLYTEQIQRLQQWSKHCTVKKEVELLESDRDKHLYFYGLLDWYNDWSSYDLPIEKVVNGFAFGGTTFIGEKNAIMLMNTSKDRYAFVGNSLSAFDDRGSWGAYDYFILDNTKRIQWGNLSDNEYESAKHVDGIESRNDIFKYKIKHTYLTIFSSSDLTAINNYINDINEIGSKISSVINLLELKQPAYTISGYIYQNKLQKILLSYHEGYGVAYPAWKEINVILNKNGNSDVLLHESIHILFDTEIGNPQNSCLLAEGVVGYAMYQFDPAKIKLDQENSILCFDDPIEQWFDERIYTGRNVPSNKLYPISAAWVRFLINEYGLDKFKKLYSIPETELRLHFEEIYDKDISELTTEFKEFVMNGN